MAEQPPDGNCHSSFIPATTIVFMAYVYFGKRICTHIYTYAWLYITWLWGIKTDKVLLAQISQSQARTNKAMSRWAETWRRIGKKSAKRRKRKLFSFDLLKNSLQCIRIYSFLLSVYEFPPCVWVCGFVIRAITAAHANGLAENEMLFVLKILIVRKRVNI